MKNEITYADESLRQKAEELLKQKAEEKVQTKLSEADSLKLMHELEVYQIELEMQNVEFQRSKDCDTEKSRLFHELEVHQLELEMQNGEINRARIEAEEIAKRYTTLYDFSPTGYFTLSIDGEILELNLCGAQMLDKERSKLINSKFGFFVSNNTKPFFQLFLDKVFITNKKETCEIKLTTDGNPPMFVLLTGVVSDNNEHCLITAIDITKRKLIEEELLLKNDIFDASIAANSIANIDGEIIEVNNSFYLNWGFKSKYEVIGKSITSFIAYDNEAEMIMKSLNETGQWEGEFTAIRSNKSTFFAYGTATVVRDKYGKIIGYQSSVIDVTNQKKAERDLQVSEQLLKIVLKHFPGVVFWKDKELNYLGCNHAFALAAGLKNSSQIYKKSDFDLPWGKTEANKFRDDDSLVLKSGISKLNIIEIQHQSENKIAWFNTSKIPLSNLDGEIIGLLGVSYDITERKLAEDALKASEVRFRKLLQDVESVSIQGYAPDGTTQYWNHASEILYGYTAEEAIGKNLLELIIPEEMKVGVKLAIDQMAETATPIPSSELMLKRKDGSMVSVFSYHTIVQVPDKPQELFCFDIDLTERKQAEKALADSEENYRFMFANNPQPMWIYDLETLFILEVNNAAIIHYGYSREEFLALTLKEIRPKEDFPALMKDLELAKADNNTVTQGRHIKKNKELIFVEVIAHSVKYNGRSARHVLINDITERKLMEFKLVNTLEELKKFAAHLQNIREEERILLARNIHDELAQILIAVKFDMGLLKQKLSKGIQSVSSDEFLQGFNQIFSLVDNTIHTSRKIMSGLRSELLELLGLIETVKVYTKEFEEKNNIKCWLTIDEQPLVFDPHKSVALFRIYQEALTNVSRHAEATILKVYIGVKSDKLIMEVIDNGKGFDQNTNSKPDTFGIIGMEERAFLLDGKLNIEAKPGKGTIVRLEIPHL